jgi:hypothetical protein
MFKTIACIALALLFLPAIKVALLIVLKVLEMIPSIF